MNYNQFEKNQHTKYQHLFDKSEKDFTTWYFVKNNTIKEVKPLSIIAGETPDFIIYERRDNSTPVIEIMEFFKCENDKLEEVSFLPIGDWPIGIWHLFPKSKIAWDKHIYNLRDPRGVEREVSLSSYAGYIFSSVSDYIKYPSWEIYDQFTELYTKLSSGSINPNS